MKLKNFIFSILIFAGCSTMSVSSHSADRLNTWGTHRYLILGDGASEELAKAMANEFNAHVVYSPSRGGLADLVKKGITKTMGPSRAMNMVMNDLRTMAQSGEKWELLIVDRAANYFLTILRNMQNEELSSFRGTVILSNKFQNNVNFIKKIQKVFGEQIEIKYVETSNK